MAKGNENGESQFGFKDKAKAEETIKLLEEHEMQYRKLTVRGLLGRAKRVLSMTKAEEKIKNIKEAMDVFEKWLEENGGGASNKNMQTDPNDKVETVPGLGFKDKEAAEKTLKILEGRDPDYQKLAIRGLIGGSKRVLSGTKNEDKIQAIKDGVKVLEDFLEVFDNENRAKLNMAYLPYTIIASFPNSDDNLMSEFVEAYGRKARGNYKHLRTMFPKDDNSVSWDIIRNKELLNIKENINTNNIKLFKDDGSPSDEHMKMIYWAYSPQIDKVKAYAAKLKPEETEKRTAEKRKAAASSSSSNDEDDEDEDDDEDDDDDDKDEGKNDSDESMEDDENDDRPPTKKRRSE